MNDNVLFIYLLCTDDIKASFIRDVSENISDINQVYRT